MRVIEGSKALHLQSDFQLILLGGWVGDPNTS